MSDEHIKVDWIDGGRDSRCEPNPVYPNGVDVVLASKGAMFCCVDIPWPAPRCGKWLIKCERCGFSCQITAAGRLDDPRSARIPCKGAHNG